MVVGEDHQGHVAGRHLAEGEEDQHEEGINAMYINNSDGSINNKHQEEYSGLLVLAIALLRIIALCLA